MKLPQQFPCPRCGCFQAEVDLFVTTHTCEQCNHDYDIEVEFTSSRMSDLELLRQVFYSRNTLGTKLEEDLEASNPHLWRLVHERLNPQDKLPSIREDDVDRQFPG